MYPNSRKWLRSPSERVGTLSHADLPPPAVSPDDEERVFVRALREGDPAAFEALLDHYYSPMLRLSRAYVRSREEAEEAVQDTWLAVLGGLDRFEGRSSLKTWIFRILVNRARSRARREARTVPFSSLQQPSGHGSTGVEPPTDEWLFRDADGPPPAWHGAGLRRRSPEECLLAGELQARIENAIGTLPKRQQEVITLRDLEGWSSAEVRDLLRISEANQRVLLHRARVKVRDELERYLSPPDFADAEATALAG